MDPPKWDALLEESALQVNPVRWKALLKAISPEDVSKLVDALEEGNSSKLQKLYSKVNILLF